MKAIISRYYKTKKKAEKHREEMQRLWHGKIAWYIVCAPNGYFVISERVARACYPTVDFSYKDRHYLCA